MTPKIPPSFDGQSSWCEFEALIDDWVNLTTLSARSIIRKCSAISTFVTRGTVLRTSGTRCVRTLSREQTSGVSCGPLGPGAETVNLIVGSLVLR